MKRLPNGRHVGWFVIAVLAVQGCGDPAAMAPPVVDVPGADGAVVGDRGSDDDRGTTEDRGFPADQGTSTDVGTIDRDVPSVDVSGSDVVDVAPADAGVDVPPPDDLGVDAGSPAVDAGSPLADAGADAGFDSGTDAGFDAGTDVGFDSGTDAGFDSGTDVGFDSGVDAGVDTGSDVPRDVGADAPDALPGSGPVPLGASAATFSQTGYAVGEAVNGIIPSDSGNDGWAISGSGGVTSAQSAVFETVTNTPTYPGGTQLNVELNFTTIGGYHLGAFRLYATTADRSMFADGASTGGQIGPNAIWSVLTPLAVTTDVGALTVRPDGSILASGDSSGLAHFRVTLATPLVGITGLRLDALEDPSLPTSGPGRRSDGNFVLSEIVVSQAPVIFAGAAPLTLTSAAATFSQDGYAVGRAVDTGVTSGGWAIARSSGATNAETAAFEFATDTLPYLGGTRLVVRLVQAHSTPHRLGRFRLLVTNASRDMFADGLATGGNVGAPAIWATPTLAGATASDGVTLTPQSDGSLYATGTAVTSTYTVTIDTPLTRLTGLRVEAIEDARLPGNGPGVSSTTTPGNFILTEVLVDAGPRPPAS